MKDAALALLLNTLARDGRRNVWWLVDEHLAGLPLPAASTPRDCLSNRVDVVRQLLDAGHRAHCSDFDCAQLPPAPEAVYFRVAKEKALTHYLINEALSRMPVGAELYLCGYKGDGIRGYVDRATQLVRGDRRVEKGKGGATLGRIVKRAEPAERLDDNNYPHLRNIAPEGEPVLFSKPGVFGWRKIDAGSVLLVRQLEAFLAGFEQPPQRIADLGCGYGYLSVAGHAVCPARYLATDNNAAAVIACRRNFAEHGIEGEVVLTDCAEGLAGPVDAVLCNPPFHRGFDIRGDLTASFTEAARGLLRPGGRALFVVNQFIALEKKVEGRFASVTTVAEDGGYKVVQLVR